MSWELKQTIIDLGEAEINLETPGEFGSREINFALVYPNTYDIAMSNLGYHAIYSQLNRRGDVVCHRCVLPNKREIPVYRNSGMPLLALESLKPICDYDILGFSISFELDYTNVLAIFDLARIPARSSKREHPLIIAGGPSVTFNPEPLASFIDAFIIGEGEEVIHRVIDVYKRVRAKGKPAVLEELMSIPGVYVPDFYEPHYHDKYQFAGMRIKKGAPATIKKCWVKDLDSLDTSTRIITRNTEFKDMYLVEVSRGCGRGCRFCMAGYCYRLPRNRSREKVLEICEEGSKYVSRIGLVGAAVSDYPHIDELTADLLERKLSFSVASLRADSLTANLARGLSASGHKTLTIAPEAASERLRRVINKGINDQDVLNAVNLAALNDISNIKMYYIIGLPGETWNDLNGIAELAGSVREILDRNRVAGRITLSINPFIPKPFTPFQWSPFEGLKTIEEKRRYIEKTAGIIPNIKIIFESPQWSLVQAVLARGSRIMGDVLASAYDGGGSISKWKKAIKRLGLDIEDLACTPIPHSAPLPWDHIDIGIDKKFFMDEDMRAGRGITVPRCTDERCRVCRNCFGLKEDR